VHDVLELSHGETQDQNGPAELIQLKFDVARLHGGDGQDEGAGVQTEREHGRPLGIPQQVMQLGVALDDDLHHELGIGVENSDEEPHPLGGAEQGNGLLDPIEEGVVAHRHELAEEEDLEEGHEGADVHVAGEQDEDEEGEHDEARDQPGDHFAEARFVGGALFGWGAVDSCRGGCGRGGR